MILCARKMFLLQSHLITRPSVDSVCGCFVDVFRGVRMLSVCGESESTYAKSCIICVRVYVCVVGGSAGVVLGAGGGVTAVGGVVGGVGGAAGGVDAVDASVGWRVMDGVRISIFLPYAHWT